MIRIVEMWGDAVSRGTSFGSAYPDETQAYARTRVELVQGGSWSGEPIERDDILELATKMIPFHEQYAPDLHDEMAAMASAAGISLEEAIVVGGFTDFVDVVRGMYGSAPEEDTCTAVLVPGPASIDGTGLLGQTWDMHDTATQHIVMLDIRPDLGPAALVFSTVGCLGQIGLNEAGVGVGINNLTAANGKPGVTWPMVVRRALQQTQLDDAVRCVIDADLAGGHNFLIVDATGSGVNIEAMPSGFHLTEVETAPFVHTNHTLDPRTSAQQAVRPDQLMLSSSTRLARARELIGDQKVDVEALMRLTRDQEAISQVSSDPYHIESCGGAVMHPATGEMWAVWGRPDVNEYERFEVGQIDRARVER